MMYYGQIRELLVGLGLCHPALVDDFIEQEIDHLAEGFDPDVHWAEAYEAGWNMTAQEAINLFLPYAAAHKAVSDYYHQRQKSESDALNNLRRQ